MVGNPYSRPGFSLAPQPQAQGLNLGGPAPAASPYQMPQVPWSQNPMITTAALGLLGGRTLNEGLQNVAQIAPAGLAAKTAMQRDMYSLQEQARTKAEEDARKAQMNEALKNWPGLSDAQKSIFINNPKLFGEYAVSTMTPKENWVSLTDPAARLAAGIPAEDTRPAQMDRLTGEIKFPGGASTNINLNEGKLTEGQSKDVNFYARGRAADKEITPQLEKALTDLPATMWSNTPLIGNYGQTAEFQTAKRAAAEFLAVVLRKDTGAAVTPQEFDTYGPMYLPVPGDTDEVLTAKRTARKRVIDSIKRGLGTARELADQIDEEMAAEAPTIPAGGTEPPIGTVEDGFRYKGGGAGNPDNWEPVS